MKSMIRFASIFSLILLGFLNPVLANEKNEPPSVKTQQFKAWTLRCVEVNGKDQCEMVQTLNVNNTNLQYTLVYAAFKNKDKQTKEVFTLIVPLGVNLQKRIALRFDGKEQLNIPYAKCEAFGCVTAINNDTKQDTVLTLFKKIQESMQKSTFVEIAVQGFTDKPIVIKTSLQGFNDARKKLLDNLS